MEFKLAMRIFGDDIGCCRRDSPTICVAAVGSGINMLSVPKPFRALCGVLKYQKPGVFLIGIRNARQWVFGLIPDFKILWCEWKLIVFCRKQKLEWLNFIVIVAEADCSNVSSVSASRPIRLYTRTQRIAHIHVVWEIHPNYVFLLMLAGFKTIVFIYKNP